MINSEGHILSIIDRYFPNKHASLQLGRGDDCAVWRTQGQLCVSTDLFLEDVHFRTAYFKPEEVGHKALAVNISDIAAMGARPLAFTLALGVPPYVELPWLEGFFSGMAALANHHRVALVGGDLSRAPHWHICITAWGEPSTPLGVHAGSASNLPSSRGYLTRGGAMPGDSLFIVGQPGLARVGLAVLEELGHEARALWPAACAAHLRPLPQVDAGLTIARAGTSSRPPVLMDVSDGLARDLPRLLGVTGVAGGTGVTGQGMTGMTGMAGMAGMADGVSTEARASSPLGAQVILPEGLLPTEVVRYARTHGLCPVTEAWLGGEEYSLLGACVPDLLPSLHAALPALISIGTVTEGGGIWCNAELMTEDEGFDHFGVSTI